MKNKYGFWKHCLVSLAGLAGLTGCEKLTCDFSYSPTSPAAGQVVTFSNSSTGADDYYWTFGDNTTSTTGSPTHIYRKPGNYTVTLLIKRNKVEKRTRTQHITVIDTIPAIACDSSTIYSFTPVRFTAQIYNPWKKAITYRWKLPANTQVLEGTRLDSAAVVCCFTQHGQSSQVELTVQLEGEKAHELTYAFTPVHRSGTSVIYTTGKNDTLEQFTYIINKKRVFQTSSSCTSDSRACLQADQDTLFYYGDRKYTVDTVRKMMKEDIRGFQVDRLMGKIYAYGHTGLWVCNITGAYKQSLLGLSSPAVSAIKVDGDGNCLYWSATTGLYCHPLLMTLDNQESFTPDTVTTQYTNITKISVNSNLH